MTAKALLVSLCSSLVMDSSKFGLTKGVEIADHNFLKFCCASLEGLFFAEGIFSRLVVGVCFFAIFKKSHTPR